MTPKHIHIATWIAALGAIVVIIPFLTGKNKLGDFFHHQAVAPEASIISTPLQPTDRSTVRAVATFPTEKTESEEGKKFVRETSATDVIKVMKGYSFSDKEEKFESLFKGRWIREPGWEGTVIAEPSRSDYTDRQWSVGVKESNEGEFFIVFTGQDISELRKGDRVRVVGELYSFMAISPTVQNATVNVVARHD
jgi:hypothetical protein